jgi:hypothetical protein
VVWETNSREGKVLAPLLTDRLTGFSIDYEEDWLLAEHWLKSQPDALPTIAQPPFEIARLEIASMEKGT